MRMGELLLRGDVAQKGEVATVRGDDERRRRLPAHLLLARRPLDFVRREERRDRGRRRLHDEA